jgi:3-deoxy-7-phosphoheptulonate synthase
MVESFLVEGKQSVSPGKALTYGQSITDACINMQVSDELLATLADAVKGKRNN